MAAHSTSIKIGFITGLQSEADILRKILPDHPVRVAAGRTDRAAMMAQELIDNENISCLISFGVAGALSPNLQIGQLCLAQQIITGAGQNLFSVPAEAQSNLIDVLMTGLSLTDLSVCYGADRAILSAAEKQSLYQETQADFVDMESLGMARVAQQAHCPFLVLRAISDLHDQTLPQAALAGMGPNGETRPLKVVAKLFQSPTDLPELIRLGQNMKQATTQLKKGAQILHRFLQQGG